MLASRPHIEPHRRADSTSVMVKEIYLSLQGESSHQGLLCTFVRLTGCHLRCRWCDSEFSFRGGARMLISEVISQVKAQGAPMVELTGGEPLLQPGAYPLMEGLLASGLRVLLETSGAIDTRLVPPDVHKIVDMKPPGSGESDRNDLRVFDSMTHRDELKFVISSRADYDWSVNLIRAHQLDKRPFSLLFSSVFSELKPVDLAQWVIDDKLPVRFQLQQHKYVWDPHARGV